MLDYQDCVSLSGLNNDIIEAISQHEHIPEIIAVELGDTLYQTENGHKTIHQMIEDDISMAKSNDEKVYWSQVLEHYETTYA